MFLNKLVFHVANTTGYVCHKTANGLRHTADKVDALGNKCDRVAEKRDPFFTTKEKKVTCGGCDHPGCVGPSDDAHPNQ